MKKRNSRKKKSKKGERLSKKRTVTIKSRKPIVKRKNQSSQSKKSASTKQKSTSKIKTLKKQNTGSRDRTKRSKNQKPQIKKQSLKRGLPVALRSKRISASTKKRTLTSKQKRDKFGRFVSSKPVTWLSKYGKETALRKKKKQDITRDKRTYKKRKEAVETVRKWKKDHGVKVSFGVEPEYEVALAIAERTRMEVREIYTIFMSP